MCIAVIAIFYSHISPSLTKFWNGSYIAHSSPAAFLSTGRSALWGLLANLLHLTALTAAGQTVLVVLLLGLSPRHTAMRPCSDRRAFSSWLCASVARLAPLGTGRTDEYPHPRFLLLLASGAVRPLGAAPHPR